MSHIFPVVVSYQVADGSDIIYTVHVHSIAMDSMRAADQAGLLATHWLRLMHGDNAAKILPDRTTVGAPSGQPGGPHFIVLSTSDVISSVTFPRRIDSDPGERMGQVLEGLDPERVFAVLFNCSELGYINTVGLTSLAAHVKRIPLHLFQVPDSVQKVFDIVGLTRYLTILPGLEEALVAIPPRNQAQA